MARATTEFVTSIRSRQVEPYWLSLLGKSGTGKTMLAKMAMRFISRQCLLFSPGYGINLTDQACGMKWPEMVREMKQGNFDDADFLCDKETKWNGITGCTCAYAFIDDIGQVEDSQKSYLLAALGRIADARLGAWTIWTSNLHLSQLAELVDPRISSRMIRGNNVVVETNCIDFNLR